ncbi:aminotransferase class I/II-fold pyridoxal phosphate-dependent enzyme [Candidatus Poribacteria bacterium]|nr:aminotransferase class I/II-fold pyridoxal phosphate-dependent enzyme [Candidatus Poribacteria bacterium]
MEIIDLRSDTVTKPTPRMRRAMAEAEVGDDCYGEDPTVNELERLAAEKMGKEAAMYVPSGTMGNTSAIMTHTQGGDFIILDRESHIYYYEWGNMAALAGVMPIPLDSPDGCPEPEQIEEYLARSPSRFPKVSLICLENTHNRRGGLAVPVGRLRAVKEIASKYGVKVHLDGARMFNAALALGVDVKEIAACADSVMFCLSKGLGAPVGSVLTGDAEFISRARRARKRLGGAMRQAGVIAAAGIVALTEMIDRLVEDHENAKLLAQKLSHLPKIRINPEKVQTNMVMVDLSELGISAEEFARRAQEEGVKVSCYGPSIVRLVTHKDVTRDQVLKAADIIAKIVSGI